MRLSRKFNYFIDDHHLVELKLPHKKFTWASSRNRALLDRYFVSIDWLDHFLDVLVQHLSSYGSNHNPLLISTGSPSIHKHQFKFDLDWLQNEEFV